MTGSLAAPARSETWTLTVEDAGPSGKAQSKLPEPVTGSKLAFDRVPPYPQPWAAREKGPPPGSLLVKLSS